MPSSSIPGPTPTSISNSLRALREYETLLHWRKNETDNEKCGVLVDVVPNQDSALGYAVRLTNHRGDSYLAKPFEKSILIPDNEYRQFQRTGNATVRIKLLAAAVDVVFNDMQSDCQFMTRELSPNLLQMAHSLSPYAEQSTVRLFGTPSNHFEHRVSTGITAFLTTLAIKESPHDTHVRQVWENVIIDLEDLYYALAEFEGTSQPRIFNIDGAPTLYRSLLYTINTLNLELLPGTAVVKRCLAHLPMQPQEKAKTDAIPLPGAILDSFVRSKFPFIALNALTAATKWSGEYLNDEGAVSLKDSKCRELDPRKIFIVHAASCYDMDRKLSERPEETDSNGLTVALICATDVLSTPGEKKAVENLAFCIAGKEDLARRYESGCARIANVAIEWKDFQIVTEESEECAEGMLEITGQIVKVWQQFLSCVAEAMTELAEDQGRQHVMPEVPSKHIMHYQNMNLYRPLRRTVNTNLGLQAKTPAGSHLLDCDEGSNYFRDRNGRKRYVVREGNELKLVKKYAHRVIYYASRVALEIGEYVLKMDLKDVIINKHTSTVQLLELMMDVRQDAASTKYALKFIEDTGMKFDSRSACFLPLKKKKSGPKLSAVLSAGLLSSVDSLVRESTGEVFILIGVRLLKLERVSASALHATEVPQDVKLRRCRINFDSVVGASQM